MADEDQAAAAAPEVVPAVETPIADAPAVETAEEPGFTPHTETPSLLATLGDEPEAPAEPVVEPKPEEPEVKAEEPAEGEKPSEEVPGLEPQLEPIVYGEFKFPEGVTPDTAKIANYTELAGKYRITPEAAQELLDLHTDSLKTFVEQQAKDTLAAQHKAFADVRQGWVTQAKADEQIGGAAWETSLGVIARARDQFVSGSRYGTPEYANDVKAFNDFLNVTGAGDHPAFLKFLHNVGRKFDEPAMPPSDIRPSPNNGVAPKQRGLRNIYRNPPQN